MTQGRRIVLHELQERHGTTRDVLAVMETNEAQVLQDVRQLNERLRNSLGQQEDVITVTPSGAWRADGVAGLVRLNQQIELEVVPKFLDAGNEGWRQDLFLVAVLVRTGHLLHEEDMGADRSSEADLATLVGRALLRLVAASTRRPIRRYVKAGIQDFGVDGEVDWESVILPDSDGFTATRLALSGRNEYNSTLKTAAEILIGEVADSETAAQLGRLARSFGDQPEVPVHFPTLPLRHRGWEGAYSLARLVVEGFGLDLSTGRFVGPGFILSTWQSWEQLCHEIVRRALRGHKVVAQQGWILGKRGAKDVFAYPDITPYLGETTDFLMDAKYKVPAGSSQTIARPDVNEAVTFLHASGRRKIDLLYPSAKSPDDLPLGSWAVFDTITIPRDGWEIRGIEVQIQGIGRRGGFGEVVRAARQAMDTRLRLHIARD